ncbi:hypothetical protein ANN_19490, partial [Periplaneta americana]
GLIREGYDDDDDVYDGHLDPQFVIFGDEEWFHLQRRVNTQNNWYWSVDNPVITHTVRTSLYAIADVFDEKVISIELWSA